MYQSPLELMRGVQGNRAGRFYDLYDYRGVAWRAKAWHVRLQPRGQLCQRLFVEILVLLVFCGGFWDGVYLFSQFQAAKAKPH